MRGASGPWAAAGCMDIEEEACTSSSTTTTPISKASISLGGLVPWVAPRNSFGRLLEPDHHVASIKRVHLWVAALVIISTPAFLAFIVVRHSIAAASKESLLAPVLPPAAPLPHPSVPLVPHNSTLIVARLNDRFANGSADNSLSKTGIVIRQFDDQTDLDPEGPPWLVCEETTCAGFKYRAQWPASIVNMQSRHVYLEARGPRCRTCPSIPPGPGGLVLNSQMVQLLCAYPADATSMVRSCGGAYASATCVPGCYPPCPSPINQTTCGQCPEVGRRTDCSYSPSHLRDALLAQQQMFWWHGALAHNEVIIDPRSVTSQLPHSIEAFFFLAGSSIERREAIQNSHRTFLSTYTLTDKQLPLLRLDLAASTEVLSLQHDA